MTDSEKHIFLNELGKRIRALRIDNDFTLDELAQRCGYHSQNARASIYGIERGKTDLPISKIKLLAKALGTTEAYLMGWETPEAPLKPLTRAEILDAIAKLDGPTAAIAMELYNSLDIDDQGEIRGEMKVMLKAEKYQEKEGQ